MKNNYYSILLLISALVTFFTPLMGQQIPYFSAYSTQPKFINPAAQGGASGGGIGVAYRSQYSNLPPKIRPITYMLHADLSPLVNDRIGVGILIMQDKVHLTNRTNVTGFFGYHLFPKESNFRLSLGAMAGILSQRMKLGEATVSNPFDLELMKASESKTKFDGGMGLQAKFLQDGGSGLHVDVTLPQLFSSDLTYAPDGTTRNVRYDLLPHLLSTVRYRWQASAFALEPTVVFRESFGKKLKKGNFDFHLRGYLLKNNLLMLGVGYRANEGGLLLSVGVNPMSNLRVQVAFENHSALGSTIELGVQYIFGEDEDGPSPCVPGPAEASLDKQKMAAETARQATTTLAITARDKIAFAKSALTDAKNATSYQAQQAKLESADKFFVQSEEGLAKIRAEVKKATAAQAAADDLLKQATANRRPLCNAKNIEPLRLAVSQVREQETDIAARVTELKNQRNAVPILLNVDDPAALQAYLSAALKNLANKPDEIKLVRVTSTSIEFQYPDGEETYTMEKSKSFVDFLAARAADMKKQGATVESVRLIAELLSSKVDSRVDANYKGEYGDPMKTAYKLNGKDKTATVKKEASLTLETIAVLKTLDVKRNMAQKMGIPEEKILLELTSPNQANEYPQMTRVVLTYKK